MQGLVAAVSTFGVIFQDGSQRRAGLSALRKGTASYEGNNLHEFLDAVRYPEAGYEPARAGLPGRTKAAAAVIGTALVGILAGHAQAAPVQPTTGLPASSAVVHTINRPAGETWFYTGGTYDISDPTILIAARDCGVLERHQVTFDGSGNVNGSTTANGWY